LLIQTIISLIPRVKAIRACSLVYPSSDIPASNSLAAADIIKIAQSALEVPVIIFLIKFLCPGASMTEKLKFLV